MITDIEIITRHTQIISLPYIANNMTWSNVEKNPPNEITINY